MTFWTGLLLGAALVLLIVAGIGSLIFSLLPNESPLPGHYGTRP